MWSKRYSIWQFILLTLALLSCWWVWHIHIRLENAQSEKHQMDAYARKATFSQLSENGTLIYQIYTIYLQHYSDKTTDFVKPFITIYDSNGKRPPWMIRALSGNAYDNIQQIVLQGDVEAKQAADINHPSTLLKTSIVTVYPQTRQATTTAPISAIQPGLIITATGADTDLQTGITHLHTEVKAHYVP